MSSESRHHIHRHAAAPWAELRTSVNTGNCYRPHVHAEYSIGIVDRGCATFQHPGGPSTVSQGSVVLIEPNVVHSCNPLRSQVWSYRMLFIEATWLHRAVGEFWQMDSLPGGLEFLTRCLEDPVNREVVDALCQPVEDSVAAQVLERNLTAWVAAASRAGWPRGRMRASEALAPALLTMHMDCGKRFTVHELAQACGLSDTQFIRRFQGEMGLTPGHYLQNLRINGARQLLSQGVALADAAYAMGFADQAHLQRAFKAHHAMTPGTYQGASARREKGQASMPA